MKVTDLLKIILKVISNNKKVVKNKADKEYFDLAIEFIEKEEKFKQMVKQDYSSITTSGADKEKQVSEYLNELDGLSKRLSNLNDKFKKYCEENKIEYTTQYDVISHIVLDNINSIFSNDENLIDINSSVGFNLYTVGVNYIDLYNKILARIENNNNKQSPGAFFKLIGIDYVDDDNENEISYRQAIRIMFNITYMIAKLRENMGAVAVKKILVLNDTTINLSNKRGKTIDLFNMLFNYDKLKDQENMDNKKYINILCELTDKNGMFSGLTEHEIAEFLYNYVVVYNKRSDILSEKEEYGFKDLNPITEMIERRMKDGNTTISKLIEDVASGKINITIFEQDSNHK